MKRKCFTCESDTLSSWTKYCKECNTSEKRRERYYTNSVNLTHKFTRNCPVCSKEMRHLYERHCRLAKDRPCAACSTTQRWKNKEKGLGGLHSNGFCKKYEYVSAIAGKILLDGDWELQVAKYLDANNFNWRRNATRFSYIGQDLREHTYCPDFYVEEWNSYLEIKGLETPIDKLKWNQFKEKLIIWRRSELISLGILPKRQKRGKEL